MLKHCCNHCGRKLSAVFCCYTSVVVKVTLFDIVYLISGKLLMIIILNQQDMLRRCGEGDLARRSVVCV